MRTVSSPRVFLAGVLALLLGIVGTVFAQQTVTTAQAVANPTINYRIYDVSPSGAAKLTVTGSGYNPAQPIYVYVCDDIALPANLFEHAKPCTDGSVQVNAAGGSGTSFKADGSFEAKLTVSLPQAGDKAIFTTADHTASDNRSQDAKVVLQKFDLPSVSSAAQTGEDETGKTLSVTTQINNIIYLNGVYVSIVDAGQSSSLTPENMGYGVEWVRPASFNNGNAVSKISIPAANLDRNKQYEVVVWKGHTMPSADTIYSVQPLQVSADTWDALFGKQDEQPSTPGASKPTISAELIKTESATTASYQITGTGFDPAKSIVVFACSGLGADADFYAEYQNPSGCLMAASADVGAKDSAAKNKFDENGNFTAVVSGVAPGAQNDTFYAASTSAGDLSQNTSVAIPAFQAPELAETHSVVNKSLAINAEISHAINPAGMKVGVFENSKLVGAAATPENALAVADAVATGKKTGVQFSIPAAKLERSKSYSLIVWDAEKTPQQNFRYATKQLIITGEEWDALFSPEDEKFNPQLQYTFVRTIPGNKAEVLVKGTGYNPKQAIYVFVCGDVQLPTDLFQHAQSCRTGAKMIEAVDGSIPTTKFAADGSFQVSMEVTLPQDGSKAIFTAANHKAPNDRTQDAKVLLQKQDAPAVQSTAAAGETSDSPAKPALVVNTTISNITYENGVYVSVVDKGQAEKLTKDNLGYAADWVMPARFNAGNASSKLVIAADKLDRKKEYEVVVWQGHTMPSTDTIYSVQPLQVSAAVWDKILGSKEPEQPGNPETPEQPQNPTAPSAVSTAEAGKTADTTPKPALLVTTKLNNITYKNGVYVAVAEKGQGKHLTQENFGVAVEWVMPNRFEDGKATSKLVIPADKLDRKKEYEVVVWQGHTMPSDDTIYSLQPLQVSEKVWDAIFAKDNGETPATPANPSNPSTPKPQPAAAAGSLVWGISGHFVAYTTCVNAQAYNLGHCAGGQINTNGVGAGYTFPQVSTEGWNKETHTGTVHYAGTVQFKGYGITMFQVVNPTIVVHNAQSATLYTGNNTQFGAASYQLDLSQARKTVGAGGDVTWSGVVVLGGMSAGEGRSILFDNLTFTVGDAAHVSYGATTVGNNRGAGAPSRTPAAKPTVGGDITVLTKAEKIVSGGRIEVSAGGFQPGESGIMVVLYSEPTVLAENLRADENGRVHWAGMLPAGLTGKHTITLQGSVMVGKEITILTAEKKAVEKSATKQKTKSSSATAAPATVAAPQAQGNDTVIWWVAAGVLVAAAAAGLVVLAAKRRKQAGE